MQAPIQITKKGIHLTGSSSLTGRLRAHFDKFHYLRLPRFVESSLLGQISNYLRTASFYEMVHKGIALESCLRPNPALNILTFAANDPAFFEIIRQITGCGEIGCFNGRVYRMQTGKGHYDSWHSDVNEKQNRMVAMSVNLSPRVYQGGRLELRQKSTKSITPVANTGFGDAILFRIAPFLDHQVTEMQGNFPKTAFAGWFQGYPKHPSLERIRKTARVFGTEKIGWNVRWKASETVISHLRGKNLVLCDASKYRCYGLDDTGQELWRGLHRPASTQSLVESLQKKYNAPAQTLRNDVTSFLGTLLSKKLIHRSDPR